MIVGFTGTRHGMTVPQYIRATDYLRFDLGGQVVDRIHHGCCLGADAEFVLGVIRARVGATPDRQWAELHAHPSNLRGMTCEDTLAHSAVQYAPTDPLERNRIIVTKCDLLIACPQYRTEEQRSGTWSTIRYARKIGRRHVIVWPDGEIEQSKTSKE